MESSSKSRILKLEGIPLEGELKVLIERAQDLQLIRLNGLGKVLHDTYFPDLEYLEVHQCNDMKYLLGKAKQNSKIPSHSLSKLAVLRVSDCAVKYLFYNPTAKCFQQLKHLELKGLPRLRSICADASTSAPTLFNAMVPFPTLEKLTIEGLDSITVLWEKQLLPIQTDASQTLLFSFSKLSVLTISGNCNLKYLFSPAIARCLQQLQQLRVWECMSMEEIILDDEGDTDGFIFHQLKHLELGDLPSLRSICASMKKMLETRCKPFITAPPLFNVEGISQVSFPSLEILLVHGLDCITWLAVAFSFKLLRELTITSCKILREIIAVEMAQRGEEVGEDEIIVFTQLQKFKLYNLPNLQKFFFSNISKIEKEMRKDTHHLHALFSKKVSFPTLKVLSIDGLHSITRLGVVISIQQLRELTVTSCENIEEMIAIDLEQSGEEVDGIHVLKKLQEIKLKSLPNLKRFFFKCGSKHEAKMKMGTSHSDDLFTSKVSFPALKVLSIHSLDSITRLRVIISIQQLQELTVTSCKKIQEIIAVDWEQREVVDDGILVFTQLQEIKLKKLPNLKRFFFNCGSKHEEQMKMDLFHSHYFFGTKVSFPTLKFLSIDRLDTITRLGVVISIHQLQNLTVTSCENIQEIIVVELGQRGEEFHDDGILEFTQLQEIKLKKLPNLKRFFSCGSKHREKMKRDNFHSHDLFSTKVSFPSLKVLSIDSLDSITRLGAVISLQQLRKLRITSCEMIEEVVAVESGQRREEAIQDMILNFTQLHEIKLKKLPNFKRFFCSKNKEKMEMDTPYLHNLFNDMISFPTLKVLSIHELDSLMRLVIPIQQLQKLKITSCEMIEEIIVVEPGQRREEVVDDRMLFFNLLREFRLKKLPNLKRFLFIRSSKNEEEMKKDTQYLCAIFSNKDSFPMLKKLELSEGSMFEGSWEGLDPVAGSFLSNVKVMTLNDCSKLVNFSSLLQRFEAVEELTLTSCSSLQIVFELEESLGMASSRVKELKLRDLPKLEHIWMVEPKQPVVSSNLTILRVENCNSLRYLFSLSIARGLTQLEYLYIGNCDVMEEIVRNEEEGEEDGIEIPIVFPLVQEMWFNHLPKLTSFCQANITFQFPSLRHAGLRKCPKSYTSIFLCSHGESGVTS